MATKLVYNTEVMIRRLPPRLQSRLVDPTAWISTDHILKHGSEAHRFLVNLWTVTSADLSDIDATCLLITKSSSAYCHTDSFGRGKYVIEISMGLISLLSGYAAVWQLANEPGATVVDTEIARRAALSMAQSVQRTGRAVPPSVSLATDQREVAVRHSVIALRFLVLHEAEHIRNDDLAEARAIDDSLAVEFNHLRECAADRAAAICLKHEESNSSEIMSALTALFELIHWLAFGVPGPEQDHPLAMARLLKVAEVIDPAEHNRLRDKLLTRQGFWYFR